MPNNYLFYISQNYSFEIIRPLQKEILARGDNCAWFVEGDKVNLNNFRSDEVQLDDLDSVIAFDPKAVFVPGNQVPNFIPGLKVQVFHGLEWKKKGHFRIRGFFDLYCTHGDITTSRFNELAKEYGYFHVAETGWSKLDPLYQTKAYELETDLPVVLYAPTFSPNLTSAVECFEKLKQLVSTGKHYWIIKFHPKMNPQWVHMYQQIVASNYQIIAIDSCLPLLQRADVLLSDTSSIISEFLLLGKIAVTYKNAEPGDYLIDVDDVEEIGPALDEALQGSQSLLEQIGIENKKLHPYSDGLSSQRILAVVDELVSNPKTLPKRKPINLLRNFKLRKRLKYWKLF